MWWEICQETNLWTAHNTLSLSLTLHTHTHTHTQTSHHSQDAADITTEAHKNAEKLRNNFKEILKTAKINIESISPTKFQIKFPQSWS